MFCFVFFPLGFIAEALLTGTTLVAFLTVMGFLMLSETFDGREVSETQTARVDLLHQTTLS